MINKSEKKKTEAKSIIENIEVNDKQIWKKKKKEAKSIIKNIEVNNKQIWKKKKYLVGYPTSWVL